MSSRRKSVIQHRQVPKAQEVHFQQPQFLQGRHHILADHGVVVFRQRHVLVYRPPGDDHAGGVSGGVAGHPLQGPGGVDELFHPLVGVIQLPQRLAQAQSVLQGDMQGTGAAGHLLGDLIHLGVGDIHDPAYVPDDATSRHGAEGDDLSHMVVTILAADVVHHLAPAGIAEIHVDIRHADPLRIQKPLKVEAVFHRVDVGDAQAIADHAARRASAPRPHGNPGALSIADEIGDDEEIVGEAHFLDHVLLVSQLLPVALIRPIPLPVTLITELFKIGEAVISRRQLELRQVVLSKCKFQAAHLRDLNRILQRPLKGAEEGPHLLLATQVEVPRLIAHPVLIVDGLSGLDAQQHIVGLSVLPAQIVGVVGADHGDAGLLVDAQHPLVHRPLVRNTVVLELQIKSFRSKQLRKLQGTALCVFILAVAQPPRDLAGETRAEGNEAAAVLPQQLHVDPGLDVKSLRPGGGHQIGQIPVTLLVLAQQHQMAALGIELMDLVEPGPTLRRHVDLAADNGLDLRRLAGAVEVDGAVHDAVIRDGAGSLAHGLHHRGQVPDAAGAVQEAELRMHMEMNEGHGLSPF